METLSYDHSRTELVPMVGVSFVMFSASVWLLHSGLFTDFSLLAMRPVTRAFSILAGGLGAVFFGYAFFYLLHQAVFPKNALVIYDRGIVDHTNAMGSRELIPFENMKEAKIVTIDAALNISIDLYDEEDYLNSLPLLKRKVQEINKKYFDGSLVSLSVPCETKEELLEIMDIINDRIDITKARKEMRW